MMQLGLFVSRPVAACTVSLLGKLRPDDNHFKEAVIIVGPIFPMKAAPPSITGNYFHLNVLATASCL